MATAAQFALAGRGSRFQMHGFKPAVSRLDSGTDRLGQPSQKQKYETSTNGAPTAPGS